MNKICIAIALLVTVQLQATAQVAIHRVGSDEIFVGPVVGYGHSWVSHLNGANVYMPSGYLGMEFKYLYAQHWGVSGVLEVSSEGYKIDYGNMATQYGNLPTFTPEYLRIPMRLYYFFGKYPKIRPEIFCGPSVAYKLTEYNTTNISVRDISKVQHAETFRPFDVGIEAGAGFYVHLSERLTYNMDVELYDGLIDAVKTNINTSDFYNPNHSVRISAALLVGIH